MDIWFSVDDLDIDLGSNAATAAAKNKVQAWLDRGDGCAVYENHDLGSKLIGHQLFFSFGSEQAQIPGVRLTMRCPDIGRPLWMYQLVGFIPPKDREVVIE